MSVLPGFFANNSTFMFKKIKSENLTCALNLNKIKFKQDDYY